MVTGTRGKVTLVESHPPQNHYVNCNPVNCHPQKKKRAVEIDSKIDNSNKPTKKNRSRGVKLGGI